MKKRDYYFDNAKFILIFFVVFGHLLRSFIDDNGVIYNIYKVIYTFHMPAFILVSGFFARGFSEKGYIIKIARKLILPYLIFQIIYSVFYYFLYNESKLVLSPLDPHWSLWFLISLFFWNVLLIGVSKLTPAAGLGTALVFGLLSGYFEGLSNWLSLSRTFVFFPMFLLGYYMNKEQVMMLTRPPFKITAALSFAAVFAGFTLYPNIDYEWLLGSKPYASMETGAVAGMLIRLGIYLLSTWMVLSFLSIVPKKQYFFTSLGKNTLYVYLLHGFFIRVFRESGVKNFFTEPETFLLLALIALLLTLLLSSNPATALTQPIIELKLSRFSAYKLKISIFFKAYRKKILSN
ncbi:acyltransferase family protein [Mesobacillus zeae]|uniref:Acyltransferase n=1 Tax=Mesobacillus zeae TaxID=1917180 RepID=A0A398BD48_9BACI|nr:acyltransferase family protein [Mesobacillus zeae]RID87792.1 acyltransferase [Mesobacillus zeae]